MTVKKLYHALIHRLQKICNTVYYVLTDKREILIVNAFVFQFFNRFDRNNLGDDLNAVLLGKLSGKRVLGYRNFFHFHHSVDNLMAIGSIIDWMGNPKTTVWGSGILESPEKTQKGTVLYSIGRVCAVRGKLTRDCLLRAGIDCPEVYGDPALLMPLLYRPPIKVVKGRIGIIPHYVDIESRHVKRLVKEVKGNGILIHMRHYRSWQEVIDLICSCEFVISSSLHGLILSDAYGIPNQWVSFSNLLSGGSFKFLDYYSSVGKEAHQIIINDGTTIQDIIEAATPHQEIEYDPIPLLKAFPYEIIHPGIRELLQSKSSIDKK